MENFHPQFICFVLVGSDWGSSQMVFWMFFLFKTTTRFKLTEDIIGSSVSFPGRDPLQSERKSLVRSHEPIRHHHWKLRRTTRCLKVGWICYNRDQCWSFNEIHQPTGQQRSFAIIGLTLVFPTLVRVLMIMIDRETFVTRWWCFVLHKDNSSFRKTKCSLTSK